MSYLSRILEASERENCRKIISALPSGCGGKLLDLGCHNGEFSCEIAAQIGTEDIHGVEFLEQHANAARSRGIDVVEADLNEKLPYQDDSFDFVHANQVIEHLHSTDTFTSEIARVLKPSGIGIISTNNFSSWHNILSLTLGLQPMPAHVSDKVIVGNPLNPEDGIPHVDKGRVHLRIFTARALKGICSANGLPVESVLVSGYYPLPPRLARIACRIDPLHSAFLIAVVRGGKSVESKETIKAVEAFDPVA